jgi:phosphorylated CTD-interacting factor 1
LLKNHQHQDEELWRVRAMASLKSYFEEQCAKHGGADMIKVIMAFERWHCRGKLREELRVDELSSSGSSSGASASSSSSCLASLDPLLPTALGAQFASAGLVADLTRVGMKPEAATAVAKELATACAKAVAAAPQHPSKVGSAGAKAPAAADASAKVTLTAHQHSNDLVVGAKLFKINHAHLQKLRALFDWHASSLPEAAAALSVGSKRKLEAADANASDSDAFHTSLFAVLARYHALGGPGYQVALNEHAFEVLRARLGVDFECFASPLNARFARFCSAHPDTDAAFGSLGSFFTCRFNRGSFFAHPPIVPELMQAMATRVNALLAATGGSVAPSPQGAAAPADEAEESAGAAAASAAASAAAVKASSSGKRQRPLSFVVMVPEWRETDMFQTLHASPYLRASWVVDAAEHGVTDGVQHQRQDRFRAAPFAVR